jgi:hypothetical protein
LLCFGEPRRLQLIVSRTPVRIFAYKKSADL